MNKLEYEDKLMFQKLVRFVYFTLDPVVHIFTCRLHSVGQIGFDPYYGCLRKMKVS